MESINVKVVDHDQPPKEEVLSVTPLVIDSHTNQPTEEGNIVTPPDLDSSIELAARIQKTHPVENIIGEIDGAMTTRRKNRADYRKMARLLAETCFLSKTEPKDMKAALQDENWIDAIQEELIQFERNEV
ncbi:hypothetical protein LIER_12458 [Lithospermum erythrorhizon]|uniref:Uncharacterized protein n=1 Tax=Lithospermum erythrorhizon TaxID=34254 RepID=A0AAV3PRZ3_LITER